MSRSTTRPNIRGLLVDLSGTLHVGRSPIPGAVDALQRLRDAGVPIRLCSNSSKEANHELIDKLQSMGFSVPSLDACGDSADLWTSLSAVKAKIRQLDLKSRPYYLLSPSAIEEIERGRTLSDDIPYDAVVVGLDPASFDYGHMNTAFRILMGEHEKHSQSATPREVAFIATHKAKYRETASPTGLSLGPGPFVAALEYATGREAVPVGKPTRDFFNAVIDSFSANNDNADNANADKGRFAVIGDDVTADLGDGAVELGLWRILVRTGKYRPGDESKPGVVPPDEVCGSFTSFVDSLLRS
ncbi:hypothetical protein FISHEDRAFT_50551 [Fistulina hepatica ATCC 64428]|uniref:HAD-like protein n=1 Tax=Fistulina hepatica ATCC 64428 TaxID=1128425 RepID=A0A0D7A1G7_9AGAR|nr:hypothetical protein FISHEDRAFT_50551 [Fistulina hepatica ATCC 64428]